MPQNVKKKSAKPRSRKGARRSSPVANASTARKRSIPAGSSATASALPTTTASAPSGKPKVGRPTAYGPEVCDRLLTYFSRDPWVESERTITRKDGSTVTETVRLPAELPTLAGFACEVGVHRDTLNEWQRQHPEFSDAVKRAKEEQERILVANGLCGLYEGPFAIFTAKNVIGWRDKVEQEISGKLEQEITSVEWKVVDPAT